MYEPFSNQLSVYLNPFLDVCVIQTEWTLVLGEQALDIYVPCVSPSASSVYVLGERNLFCLRDNGQIRFMKKLEYNPSCFLPYASGKSTIQSPCASFPPVHVNPDHFCPSVRNQTEILPATAKRPNVLENKSGYLKNILLSHRRLWRRFMASFCYICYSLSQLFLTVLSEEIHCALYLLLMTARSAKSPCKAMSFLMRQDAFICATSQVYQIKHADSCVRVGFGTETAPNTDPLCVAVLGCECENIRLRFQPSPRFFNTLRQPSGVNTPNTDMLQHAKLQ